MIRDRLLGLGQSLAFCCLIFCINRVCCLYFRPVMLISIDLNRFILYPINLGSAVTVITSVLLCLSSIYYSAVLTILFNLFLYGGFYHMFIIHWFAAAIIRWLISVWTRICLVSFGWAFISRIIVAILCVTFNLIRWCFSGIWFVSERRYLISLNFWRLGLSMKLLDVFVTISIIIMWSLRWAIHCPFLPKNSNSVSFYFLVIIPVDSITIKMRIIRSNASFYFCMLMVMLRLGFFMIFARIANIIDDICWMRGSIGLNLMIIIIFWFFWLLRWDRSIDVIIIESLFVIITTAASAIVIVMGVVVIELFVLAGCFSLFYIAKG